MRDKENEITAAREDDYIHFEKCLNLSPLELELNLPIPITKRSKPVLTIDTKRRSEKAMKSWASALGFVKAASKWKRKWESNQINEAQSM